MAITRLQSQWKIPTSSNSGTFLVTFSFLQTPQTNPCVRIKDLNCYPERRLVVKMRRDNKVRGWLLPVDPWAPNIDSESIASQLFAVSLFPYLGFLYFITKSKSAPKLTLFGFYFLLAFVGATGKFIHQLSYWGHGALVCGRLWSSLPIFMIQEIIVIDIMFFNFKSACLESSLDHGVG